MKRSHNKSHFLSISTQPRNGGQPHKRLVKISHRRSVDQELEAHIQDHKECCWTDTVDYQVDGIGMDK